MFDILEKLARFVLGAAEFARGHSDRRVRSDFAKGCLATYLDLLEVVDTGEDILNRLRSLAALPDADPRGSGRVELQWALESQAFNLRRLGRDVERILEPLLVFAPEFRVIRRLVARKVGIVGALSSAMKYGYAPLRPFVPSVDDVPDLREVDRALFLDPGASPPPFVRIGYDDHIFCVAVHPPWSGDPRKEIARFVEEADSNRIIENLLALADRIRDTVVGTFSLEEVLRAGKERREGSAK